MSNVIPFTPRERERTDVSGYQELQVPCDIKLEFSDGSIYELGDQLDFHGAHQSVNQSLASTRLFQLQMVLLESPDRAEWINAQLERIIQQVYK